MQHNAAFYLGLPCLPNYPFMRFPVYNWFQGDTSFADHLCFLCLVFLMLLRLFIAALCSPDGKGLTS